MTDKPLGYFVKDKQGWWAETDKETGIPFYTHPVKELTDEEAIKLWDSIDIVPNEGMTGRLKVFAKAILRKAQEK